MWDAETALAHLRRAVQAKAAAQNVGATSRKDGYGWRVRGSVMGNIVQMIPNTERDNAQTRVTRAA